MGAFQPGGALIPASTGTGTGATAGEIATAVSTLLTTLHGAGSWQGGGGGGISGPSAVTLTFVDADGAPVPNVEFTVIGQGSARAGTNGIAAFGLPNGVYQVAAAITARVVFPQTTLTVAGATALEIEGAGLAITPPADRLMCRVEAYLLGPDAAAAKVVFELLPADAPAGAAGHLYAGRKFTGTAVAGFLSIDLYRGETYRLQSPALRFTTETITLSGSTFDLSSVLDD